jgi:hypothetical protein
MVLNVGQSTRLLQLHGYGVRSSSALPVAKSTGTEF